MEPHEIIEHLYSESLVSEIQKVKSLCREILTKEMKLLVTRNRFYVKDISYPFDIVAFEHPKRLGYFDPEFYEIGIHKALLLMKNEKKLKNILRHELAHYLTWIHHGTLVSSHGAEYQTVCQRYGWGTEVSAATTEFSEENLIIAQSSGQILSKIQKLLALASSPNVHESESATLKANALLIKHQLQAPPSNEPHMVLRRILRANRSNAKLHAICSILRTFFVYPVMNHTKESVYVEIFGEKTNVEIADYVAHFLDHKMEQLWAMASQKYPHLKGLASKNSFFRGIADGYRKQMRHLQDKESACKQAILKIENTLERHIPLAFPKLSTERGRYRHCEHATAVGRDVGKDLRINPAVSNASTSTLFLPNY